MLGSQPADSTAAKPIEKNTYIGVPLAGAGRDHGKADDRNSMPAAGRHHPNSLQLLTTPYNSSPATGHAAHVTHIMMVSLLHVRRAVAPGPLPPSTTKPAMSNKELEDKKTFEAQDKGYIGTSM